MKISLIAISLLLLGSTFSFAQTTAVVRGKVRDSATRTAIEGADIFLLTPKDEKPLFHTHTGPDGFIFRQVPDGSYRVVTAATGYDNDTSRLTIKDGVAAAVTISLHAAANELEGVVIKSTPPPVSVKGDTVSYHADAFAVQRNAQLEDLLRKLPGVEVDKDGNITMQGQKVDKITVNGKDLFLGNTKMANSLPADMISSVEAYATQSDRAKFSGVKEPSTTKTLNLKTKKGMDNAYFGNAYAGMGNAESYATGGSFTQLGGSRLLVGNLKLNNINNRFVGVESKNLGQQSGIQSTASLDLNYREKWGKKLTATIGVNGSSQKTDALQTTNRRTFYSDTTLLEDRLSHNVNETGSLPVNMMLLYELDSTNQIQYTNRLMLTDNTSSNQDTAATETLLDNGQHYLASRSQTSNTNSTKGYNLSQQLDWNHRFAKPGRTFQLSMTQSSHRENSPGSVFSILNTFDATGARLRDTTTNQQYSQVTNGVGYGGTATYTEPLAGKQFLSFTYTFNTQLEKSDKKSSDFDSTTGGFDKVNLLTTNRFNNRNTSHRMEAAYGMNGGKVNYQLGLGLQYSTLDNLNFSPDRHINQHFTNIFPRAMLNFNLKQGKSLSVNYTGSSSSPTIEQLQPLPDITNPFLVKTGNPDLKQQFNHSVNAYYNAFNMKTFKGILVSIQGDVVQNQIVSAVNLLDGGVQETKYVNVNGVYHVGTTASYNMSLGKDRTKMQQNISIATRLRYGHDITLTSGKDNISNSITWGQTLRYSYNLGKRFITDFTGGIDYTGYQYSIRPEQNTKSWSQNATANVSYELPWSITIQSNYTWMHLGTSGLLPSRSTGVLNAAIYKRLFASQQWQLRVSGFDLLNTNRNYTQSAGSNYIYTQQTNLLQRMFLVSIVYDFRYFPGLKKGSKGPTMMSPMGMPVMGY